MLITPKSLRGSPLVAALNRHGGTALTNTLICFNGFDIKIKNSKLKTQNLKLYPCPMLVGPILSFQNPLQATAGSDRSLKIGLDF